MALQRTAHLPGLCQRGDCSLERSIKTVALGIKINPFRCKRKGITRFGEVS